MIDIEKLRQFSFPDCIALTKHAKNRMFERGIGIDDISSCILNGEIIQQYEDDKLLSSCLVLGKAKNRKQMHIVVSSDDEFICLITAYYPDPEEWDADFRNRKEV